VSLRLTDEQEAIVAHNQGPALVFAVAGAGKTTSLVHRLERLVRERVFEPRKVLAASFSRMAVDDLKRSLARWPHTQGVQVSTLHALGYRIVRKAASEGLLKLAEGREEGAQQALLQRTLRRAREMKLPWTPELENLEAEDFLSYVGACKGNLQYADLKGAGLPPEALKVASQAPAPQELEWYLELYRLMEQVRREEGLLTFDDMLMSGWEVLVRYPGILQTAQKAFQAVLVDEFQDVNLAQVEMLDLITAPHRNYMAVGDDDQTIYEWRGASPRFILEFAPRYKAAKYIIRDSFRCPAPQVALAGRVIAQNQNREPKRLSLTKGFGGRVYIRLEPHMPAQAQSLVSDVAGLLAEGRKPSQMAVLVRLYAQTPYIEQCLIERQIPYRVVGSVPFYQRPEIQVLLAYLWLAQSPTAARSPLGKGAGAEVLSLLNKGGGGDYKRLWLQIYNTPRRYLSRALADSVWRQVERGASLVEALTAVAAGAEERAARRLRELADLFAWLSVAVERGSAHAVLEALESRLDYRRYLLGSSGFYEVGAGKAEGVRAFLEYARDKGSALQLLHHIEQLAQEQIPDGPDGTDWRSHTQEHLNDGPVQDARQRVSLMTIFRAKGLEWPLVFIPDCNQGTLPYSGSENLEEERRLFYVALTRSSQHTYLYALASLPLSPFLVEAEHLQVLGAVERVGEALALKAHELSTAQTLALAQGARKLGLERFLYGWWNSGQAQSIAAKVLRLFAHAQREGYSEALGLTHEARSVWEAFDAVPGSGVEGEFSDLERFIFKPIQAAGQPVLRAGQKVRHTQFGTGLVVSLDEGVASIAFADGVRRLALRYARLEVVG
jgi:DNA helicase-2/ATP-dependent DNA helicase PcrA